MDVKSLLPSSKGILPYYMLILSAISIGNSLQAYATLHYTRRVYNARFVRNPKLPRVSSAFNPEDSVNKLIRADGPQAADQVTPLTGRLFGTWTLITCIIRCYAAYNLHLAPLYDITVWTYVVALAHFTTELFVFKSMPFGLPQCFPFSMSSVAIIWMLMARGHYVKSS